MKNTQKGFVIPLVIAFIVILIGGGIYVANHGNWSDSLGWKSYSYGYYTFDYPSSWHIETGLAVNFKDLSGVVATL